jgi:phosphomevalonate kinase
MDNIKQHLPGFVVGVATGVILARALLAPSTNASKVIAASDANSPQSTAHRVDPAPLPASVRPVSLPNVAPATFTHVKPVLWVLLSGKRASGKDFVAKRLAKLALAGQPVVSCSRISMGDTSKQLYAEEQGLGSSGYVRLMEDRDFKEQHRAGITALYEKKIGEDRGFFHKLALSRGEALSSKVIMVTDTRVPFDIEFFKRATSIITIRINADDATRRARGWDADPKKDAHETECGLDSYTAWDLVFDGSGDAANPMGNPDALDKFINEKALPLLRKKAGVDK